MKRISAHPKKLLIVAKHRELLPNAKRQRRTRIKRDADLLSISAISTVIF